MPLIDIVRQALGENGWPVPVNGVVNATDPNMVQCLALANRELRSLGDKRPWPSLMRTGVINVVDGTTEYPLPVDFDRFFASSAVDATKYAEMKGSISTKEFYQRLIGKVIDWYPAFRLSVADNKILTSSASAGPLYYVYITKSYAVRSDGAATDKFYSDSDRAVLSETLVTLGLSWRWRQKKGLDYTAEIAEYNSAVIARYAAEMALGEIPIGRTNLYDTILTVPDTGAFNAI